MSLRELTGVSDTPALEARSAAGERASVRASVPAATYRLQMGNHLSFAKARRLVPYLASLGVSTLYLSPIFRARASSEHGYDVTDPRELDPRLGSESDFGALSASARRRGLSLILDIVPNHLAASTESPFWRELLEDGESAPCERIFDFDWRRVKNARSRIALPVLGEPYAAALEGGRLRVVLEAGKLALAYWDQRFPLDPATLAGPLERLARGGLASASRLAAAFARIPGRADVERRRERPSLKAAAAKLLAELARTAHGAAILEGWLARLNGQPGDAQSFNDLDELLSAQAYRLGFWRSTTESIPYRRFFDVSELVGVRVEDPRVFELTHALPLRLVREGLVSGLRVDHVDGLLDPQGYLERLRARVGAEPYLVVEKILTGDEQLPEAWPVDGTTGYEFLKSVNGVFADPRGVRTLERLHRTLTESRARFSELTWTAKARLLAELFPGEIAGLSQELARLAALDRHAQDVAPSELAHALAAVTASLSVYRTYTRTEVSPRDRALVERAVELARRQRPGVDPRAYAFVTRVLTVDFPPESQVTPAVRELTHRWQQLTGPVTAKGLEDTAIYAYARLLSLNVIGGLRSRARSLAELHDFQKRRQARGDLSLLTMTTHDTKRSEDVRARIHVLSEVADDWSRRVVRWRRWNEPHRSLVNGHVVPTASEELLLYQTLLGAWPHEPHAEGAFRDRLRRYLVKAAREAKVHTTWLSPDEEHERALTGFADRILEPAGASHFLSDFHAFRPRIALHGAVNALAQLVIKLGSPGVADFYQGSELWDLRLVDPDNRGPVDFRARARLLRQLDARAADDLPALLKELRDTWTDGRVKLFVTSRGLRFRTRERELLLEGDYLPLEARGAWRDHVVAFARRLQDRWALVLAPRLLARRFELVKLPEGTAAWGDASLRLPGGAPREWRNVLTEELVVASGGRRGSPSVRLADAWAQLPVAILESRS